MLECLCTKWVYLVCNTSIKLQHYNYIRPCGLLMVLTRISISYASVKDTFIPELSLVINICRMRMKSRPAIYFSQDLWQEEVVECRTPDRRRCHELPCFSYPMSPQQVGHKPTPAQSTWEHWLCIFLPLPSMHKDLVASGRMVADKGDVTVISKPA